MNAEEKAIRLHCALSDLAGALDYPNDEPGLNAALYSAKQALYECAPLADWEKYIRGDVSSVAK